MKIIVLSLAKYREKDVIVNAISEETLVTFKATGVLSPNHKNAAINNVLTVADASIKDIPTGKKILKDCSIIYSPLFTGNDLTFLTCINTIAEATNKMLSDNEKHLAFSFLDLALTRLQEKENPLLVTFAYIIKLMKFAGLNFDINHCVKCGTKENIVGFSLASGGFLCRDCLTTEEELDFTGTTMLTFRKLCGSQDFKFDFEVDEIDLKHIFLRIIYFLRDYTGVYLDSPKLIINY